MRKLNEFLKLIRAGDFKKIKSKILIKFGTRETLFTEFYKDNVWGSSESVSGPGSELKYTENIIKKLPELLENFSIGSISDAPCGDFHFMKEVNLDRIVYCGYDIVKQLIEKNNEKYSKPNIAFRHFNVIEQVLPKSDLIFSRDMLIHFSYKDAIQTIRNFRNSGSRYLLTNTYPAILNNRDIKTGSWRPVNLLLEPYCFNEPLAIINEYDSEEHGMKQLALFILNV